MTTISNEIRQIIDAGPLAHLTTLNADGSPQVTIVWIGLDGDNIVAGHLGEWHKVTNMRRDPRIAISIQTGTTNDMNLDEYIVIYGAARITSGGAPELLQRLAHTYIGADTKFPPINNPPNGVVTRITVNRITGVGPWANQGH